MRVRPIRPAGAPAVSTYTPGMLIEGGRLLFVSGQIPPDFSLSIESQIRQTLVRIGRVLTAAGADFADLVMIRGYFTHLSRDLETFRRVRVEFLREPYPASTIVGVAELALPGQELELEAVAVLARE